MVQIVVATRGQVPVEVIEAAQRACGGVLPKYISGHISAADTKSRAVWWFLHNSRADHFLLLDDDLVPPPNLLRLAEQSKEIVSGLYLLYNPIYGLLPYECAYMRVGSGYVPAGEMGGLVEVDAVASGCLCIHRSVLEAVRPAFADHHDSWGRISKSDDFHFCEAARTRGFRVWADYDVRCEHIKPFGIRRLVEQAKMSTIMEQAFERAGV